MNYFNDNEPYVAEWLRNLFPKDDVDSRSILEVEPHNLTGYNRCHFFAGIGGWQYALELADWHTDAPVWTASLPCQPFSTAGKRGGEADERHLWPVFRRLVAECLPPVIFGEQVASKDGRVWLSRVRADLEALGYGVGASDLCAAGIGAPHIRQRLYWVAWLADPGRIGSELGGGAGDVAGPQGRVEGEEDQRQRYGDTTYDSRSTRGLADPAGLGLGQEHTQLAGGTERGDPEGWASGLGSGGSTRGVADTADLRRTGRGNAETAALQGDSALGTGEHPQPGVTGQLPGRPQGHSGARGMADTNDSRPQGRFFRRDGSSKCFTRPSGMGPWGDFDLVECADGKIRRIEPGTPPLADGVPARVGKLRAYGNAIVPPLAAEFIAAFREAAGL